MSKLKKAYIALYSSIGIVMLFDVIFFITHILLAQSNNTPEALGLAILAIIVPTYSLILIGILLVAAITVNVIYAVKNKKEIEE